PAPRVARGKLSPLPRDLLDLIDPIQPRGRDRPLALAENCPRPRDHTHAGGNARVVGMIGARSRQRKRQAHEPAAPPTHPCTPHDELLVTTRFRNSATSSASARHTGPRAAEHFVRARQDKTESEIRQRRFRRGWKRPYTR